MFIFLMFVLVAAGMVLLVFLFFLGNLIKDFPEGYSFKFDLMSRVKHTLAAQEAKGHPGRQRG